MLQYIKKWTFSSGSFNTPQLVKLQQTVRLSPRSCINAALNNNIMKLEVDKLIYVQELIDWPIARNDIESDSFEVYYVLLFLLLNMFDFLCLSITSHKQLGSFGDGTSIQGLIQRTCWNLSRDPLLTRWLNYTQNHGRSFLKYNELLSKPHLITNSGMTSPQFVISTNCDVITNRGMLQIAE